MDRYTRWAFHIAALLLVTLVTAWAMPSPPFVLAEYPEEARDQSPEFVKSAQASVKFKRTRSTSVLLDDRDPRWWRLTATRDIASDDSPQLVMTQPYFKQLEVWRPGDAVAVRRSMYGPDSDLTHSALLHVVPLPNGLRRGDSIFVRITSLGRIPSEFSVLPLREVYRQDDSYNRIRTSVLTALGLVAALALGHAFSLRQRGYAYLAATLLAQTISLAIEGGDFRSNDWLAAFATDRRTNILLNTVAVLASVRFLMFYLNLPMTQVRAARILNVCSYILGAVVAVSLFKVWRHTATVGNLVLLCVMATVIAAGTKAVYRRQREAFILLGSWAPLMVVLFVKIGGLQHWWPPYEWIQYGYPAAITFGGMGLFVGLNYKLHQLRDDRDAARQRATYDGLTGVLTRPALEEAIALSVAQSHGSGDPLCVAFIDVDRFKSINDEYGHATGDEVLRIVAKRLRNRLRSQDVLGRYGGDEMVVVLPNATLAEAVRQAEQLRRAIADSPIAIEDKRIAANLSVGVAQLKNYEPVSELLERADSALYASKREGRGRVTGHGEHAEAMP
ncbi:diguanylate cyclase [Lysobacter sp. K5869]|uniref:GGDEF domain-containing protein n=1 Tax=Lysobacter sp. K5869 TaxID=2820808 RepID=UPI001C062F2F|nr:diguanylate cyclase [Lysobacter sp. K5869]QWP76088.1 diguanylate cyclase [Lysobacter sp. K5869]